MSNIDTRKALELAREALFAPMNTTKFHQAIAGIDAALAPAAPVAQCASCDDTGDVHTPTGEWRGRCTCAAGAATAAPAVQADSMDGLKLYAELRDLCDEANAVDTIIGRPELFRSKLFALRDRIGAATYTATAAPVAPAGYLEGVNVQRLILALSRMGCATEGHEGTAASLADNINRLTQAVMRRAPSAPVAQPLSEPSDDELTQSMLKACPFYEPSPSRDAFIMGWERAVLALRPAAPRAPLIPRGFLLHWPKPGGGRELIWSEKDGAGVMIGCPVEPVFSRGVRKEGGAA